MLSDLPNAQWTVKDEDGSQAFFDPRMKRSIRPKLSKAHPVQLGMVLHSVTAVALLLILIILSTPCASGTVRSVSATIRAHSTQRGKVKYVLELYHI